MKNKNIEEVLKKVVSKQRASIRLESYYFNPEMKVIYVDFKNDQELKDRMAEDI